VIKLGELEIDILNRTVRAGTSELHLTTLGQSLLYLLAANAGSSPGRRSSTRCGGASTTSPRATSWTARFGSYGNGCRMTGFDRASSPRFRTAAIDFCPHSPTLAQLLGRLETTHELDAVPRVHARAVDRHCQRQRTTHPHLQRRPRWAAGGAAYSNASVWRERVILVCSCLYPTSTPVTAGNSKSRMTTSGRSRAEAAAPLDGSLTT
jgi:hypothetical protein